jgi:hypothetical protein
MASDPNHLNQELAVKISIELTTLIELYERTNSPDLLERIKLKEQLLKELKDFFARQKTIGTNPS